MTPRTLLLAACLASAPATSAAADTFFVDASATGANNGTTWANAFTSLADAMALAQDGDEIWIANGTYLPPALSASFLLRSGVRVYGGFAGGETSIDDRDPVANLTIIEGDRNGNDGPDFTNRSDNAGPLVEVLGTTGVTRLDGLVFTGGFANTGLFEGGAVRMLGGTVNIERCLFIDNGARDRGGALFLVNMDTARIRDSVFTVNATSPNAAGIDVGGGALWFEGNELFVVGSEFAQNFSIDSPTGPSPQGGAIFAMSPTVHLERTNFTENSIGFAGASALGTGGAVFIDAAETVDVDRCRFIRNSAGDLLGTGSALSIISTDIDTIVRVHSSAFVGNGTELSSGGAIAFRTFFGPSNSALRVTNSQFTGNFGGSCPAIYSSEDVVIRNSTIANNAILSSLYAHAVCAGLGFGGGVDITVENSILWDNRFLLLSNQSTQFGVGAGGTITVNRSIIDGWNGTLPGSGGLDADPLFNDPDGPDNTPNTNDDDFSLGPFSPAIDAGSNPLIPPDALDIDDDGDTAEDIPLDLAGNPRRADDTDVANTGVGVAPIVDVGAFERQRRSCIADLSSAAAPGVPDGLLTGADFFQFLTLFSAGDLAVDFSSPLNPGAPDGVLSGADFFEFLNLFNAGC